MKSLTRGAYVQALEVALKGSSLIEITRGRVFEQSSNGYSSNNRQVNTRYARAVIFEHRTTQVQQDPRDARDLCASASFDYIALLSARLFDAVGKRASCT